MSLLRESVYQKVIKCLGSGYTLQLLDKINKFQTATPLFSGSSYPMRSTGMLYDPTGSVKSNMASSKLEIPVLEAANVYFSLPVVKKHPQ